MESVRIQPLFSLPMDGSENEFFQDHIFSQASFTMTRQTIVIATYLGLLGCAIYGGVEYINHRSAIADEDKHFRYLVEQPPEPSFVPDALTGDASKDIQTIQDKIASLTLPSPGFVSRKIGVAKGAYNVYLIKFTNPSQSERLQEYKAIAVTKSELVVGMQSGFVAFETILLTKMEPYRYAPDRLFGGKNLVGDYDRMTVCVDVGGNPLASKLAVLESKKAAEELEREKAKRRAEEAETAAREEQLRLEKTTAELDKSRENAARLETERLMNLACGIKATVDVCADELPATIKGLTKENVSRTFADENAIFMEYAAFIRDGMKELPSADFGEIMRSESYRRYIEVMATMDVLSQTSLRKRKKWEEYISTLPGKQTEQNRNGVSIRESAESGRRMSLEQKRQERCTYYLGQSQPPTSVGQSPQED